MTVDKEAPAWANGLAPMCLAIFRIHDNSPEQDRVHLPLEHPLAAAMIPFLQEHAATPLVDLPRLAAHCEVARILVKNEAARPLGSFKSLGGMFAGLRALARSIGVAELAELRAQPPGRLPRLLCASDGNHGLAVAAAAALAGGTARVYLPRGVAAARAQRIAGQGAEIVWVAGTYDDAVDAAAEAAQRGDCLLISDTSADPDDPVVADVLAGYGVMADELAQQLRDFGERPTHLFVQAGVGGLAAALAEGLAEVMTSEGRVVVVEPEAAACVAAALRAGRPVRIAGDLVTSAEMLACGEASAPAVRILLKHGVKSVAVPESALAEAVHALATFDGPATTPSGAAGLAGLLTARPGSPAALDLGVDATSRVLLIVSEGPIPKPPRDE